MEVIRRELDGVILLEPRIFSDDRGMFFESFKKSVFNQLTGTSVEFIQDNHSVSGKNVLRGLHFQRPPFAQGKLVRVVKGSAIDVVVDLRKSSKFYGQTACFELNENNHRLLWIPEGFAHGFESLEEETVFLYKCTKEYQPEAEDGLMWNDPDLSIQWKTSAPELSEKDKNYGSFSNFSSPF